MDTDQQSPPAYLYCGKGKAAWQPLDVPAMPHGGPPLFIALKDGEPWFAAAELCAILGIGQDEVASYLAADDMSGLETDAGSLALISEYGLHVLACGIGCRREGAPLHPILRWAVKSLLPAVRKAAQPGIQAVLPGVSGPPEIAAHVLADFVRKKLRESRQSLAAMNCSRLLAHLWQNHSNGQWVDVSKPGKLVLAQTLETSPRSLGRALDCLVKWEFVERRSFGRRSKRDWPDSICVKPGNIQAALSGFGLELPAP